ncbi:hypothetical protein LCGC14_1635000 [marine sediment metagenome]|uniref:Uncharacterized protein n=1 Tax=marine sediment metagenome TaxID=412755 RepID=A0A0F9KH26_9ZZZZ
MIKYDKPSQEIEIKDYNELDWNTDFYKALNTAISTNNIQSLYKLSKIFTRHCFKKLEN